MNFFLKASGPLSGDVYVADVKGREAVSELFEYRVVLQLSDSNVAFDDVVGKELTVALELEDGSARYISGVVGRWLQGENRIRHCIYYGVLYPTLWLLRHTRDCRIFQQKSTPDIIEQVFSDHGLSNYRLALTGSYDARDFCVQYRETAFDFVSRLMEEEGIFYFFEHDDGKHTLVLADDKSAFAPVPNFTKAQMAWSPEDDPTERTIDRLRVEQRIVTGAVALDDFNFETPDTQLFVSNDGDAPGDRIYDYPGLFANTSRGEALASIRMDACASDRKLSYGRGFCRAFTAGYKFELERHERSDFNQEYVLRKLSVHATQDGYTNDFVAAPASEPYRPPRKTRKPRIAGTQTAVVVGKSGEEIWTDSYGRIKVQFHWDQEGKKDENSSCWIRVAQGWAGKSWGAMFIPRIGQEVVVSFLEGDPDRPLVTGCVYNGSQTVPYTLPDEQTKSTIKSNSSKGGGGFNEIRFEDKKDSEEIFVHAQKDKNTVVENDAVTHVKNHRQIFVQEGDPSVEDSVKDLLKVEGDRKITVAGGDTTEEHINEGKFTQKVTKEFTLKVEGSTLTIEAVNNLVIKGKTVSIEATGGDFTIKSAQKLTQTASMDVSVKSNMNVKVEAGMNMESKAGISMKNQAVMIENKADAMLKEQASGMAQIQGVLVKIN